ncbi:MAG: hypothetical protein JSU65_07425, partial [Candidatus Zixiibacteriota bacterium]
MRRILPAIAILLAFFSMSNLMSVTYAGDPNGDSSNITAEHAEYGQDTLRLAIHAMMINAKRGVQSWRPDSVKEAVAL